MFKYLLITFIILLSAGFLVFAADDQGEPNDPTINDRANACYEDGSMAGKCDTVWEWECGWYLIRFESGMISPDRFPTGCVSVLVLPPEVAAGIITPSIGCQLFTGSYVFFTGNFLPIGAVVYSDAACTTPVGNTLVASVYAPGGVLEATNICTSNGLVYGGFIGGDVHHCN